MNETHTPRAFRGSFDGFCVVHAPFATGDRRVWFEKELTRIGVDQYVGIEAQQIPEKDPRLVHYANADFCGRGMLSVADAYKACMDYAIDQGWQSVCVFEDDVVFRPELNQIWEKISPELQEENWDVLYFSRWHPMPVIDAPRPIRLLDISSNLCLHAFAVRHTAFTQVKNAVDQSIQHGTPIDARPFMNHLLAHHCRVRAPSRNLAGQAGGFISSVNHEVRKHNNVSVYRMRDWYDVIWHLRWLCGWIKERISTLR